MADATLGHGLLGTLEYTPAGHLWAIEFGQLLGALTVQLDPKWHKSHYFLSNSLRSTLKSLDRVFAARSIPRRCNGKETEFWTASAIMQEQRGHPQQTIVLLGGIVKDHSKTSKHEWALSLIGLHTYLYRTECHEFAYNKEHMAAMLRTDIKAYSKGGSDMQPEALSKKVFDVPKDNLTVNGLSELFLKSSDAVRVVLVPATHGSIDQGRLALQRGKLEETLNETKLQDNFSIQDVANCRMSAVKAAVIADYANILHISSNGSDIMFQDDLGQDRRMDDKEMSGFFKAMSVLQVVIVTGNYQQEQAKELSEMVKCVIVMEQTLDDDDAETFLKVFYGKIGDLCTTEAACWHGVRAVAAIHKQEVGEVAIKLYKS